MHVSATISNDNELKAFPLDAGTDNGFTFTSPNWETEPRGEVFQITNRFKLLRIRQILVKLLSLAGSQVSQPPSRVVQLPTPAAASRSLYSGKGEAVIMVLKQTWANCTEATETEILNCSETRSACISRFLCAAT